MTQHSDPANLEAQLRSLEVKAPQCLDERVLAIPLATPRPPARLRFACLATLLCAVAAALFGAARPAIDRLVPGAATREVRLGFPMILSARALAARVDLIAVVSLAPSVRSTPLPAEILAVIEGDRMLEGTTIELVPDPDHEPTELSPLIVSSLLDPRFATALVALRRAEGTAGSPRFTTWSSPRLEATIVPSAASTLDRPSIDTVLAYSLVHGSVEERRSSAVALARSRGFPVTERIPIGPLRSSALIGMTDSDAAVRWQCGLALSTSTGTDVAGAMMRVLFDPCRIVRQPAKLFFSAANDVAALEFMRDLEDYELDEYTSEPLRAVAFGTGRGEDIDPRGLDDDQPWLRARVAWQAADHAANESLTSALIRALGDSASNVRRAAAWSLGKAAPKLRDATCDALADVLDDSDPRVGCAAARSLTLLGDERGSAWLALFATSGEDDVVLTATEFAGEVGGPDCLEQVIATSTHSRPALRAHALLAAASLADRHPEIREIVEWRLVTAASDGSQFVREAARCARTRIR